MPPHEQLVARGRFVVVAGPALMPVARFRYSFSIFDDV
jgi:hypothetical protein